MSRPKAHTGNDVFVAIKALIRLNDQPPTIEELRVFLKVGSTRTVLRYLRQLEYEGYIRRWSGARGIALLPRPQGLRHSDRIRAGMLVAKEKKMSRCIPKPQPTNDRGFFGSSFKDQDGLPCQITESSLATDFCLWLGLNEGVHHMGRCLATMHLNRSQAAELIPLLQQFVKTGRLR